MFSRLSTHTTLLTRLADGNDRTAWDDFCARYGELIRRFAQRQGLQPADCDDCLQEVQVKLTRSLPQFEYNPAKGKFRSYLKTVVQRAVYDRFQQKGRASVMLSTRDVCGSASTSADADQAWEIEWRQYHVYTAMRDIESEFSTRCIRAFETYAVNGEPAQVVANQLGMSLEQVYQSKSRIMKRLSEVIARQIEEEG
jgi:RNA polymerase sigma-70 factor (ECF subfamily)